MRAIWNGAIGFGLVNIPIKLYSATDSSTLDLDMLDSKDLSNIRFKRVNEKTGKEVVWENIVKGYKVEDKYIVLNDEDFTEQYATGTIIFCEGNTSSYYFQIIKRNIKLNNYNEGIKEYIQDILDQVQSVGALILFMDKPYPINAVTLLPYNVLKLSQVKFFALLERHLEHYLDMLKSISHSMYFKYIMDRSIKSQTPLSKLRAFMDYLKSLQDDTESFSFQIPLKRQQLTDFIGLCVETSIRNLKMMERDNIVQIRNHKVFIN